jgi:hypothetical protein
VLSQVPVYTDPLRTVGPLHAPLSGPVYVPHVYGGPVPATVTVLVGLLLVAATFGSWLFFSGAGRGPVTALGASASAFLLIGAPVQYLAVYFSTSAAETQSRYVYSVLPAMMITAALLMRPRARWAVGALAFLGVSSIVVVSLWSRLV